MTELIVAVLSAIAGLIGFRMFSNWSINRNQNKLEMTVRDFDKIEARLEGQQEQEDKETKEKVDEITKEQNDKPTGSKLADWFNRRK
jgi:hypothetical protein